MGHLQKRVFACLKVYSAAKNQQHLCLVWYNSKNMYLWKNK